MPSVRVSPPVTEPLALADVRAHLRIDESAEDAQLAGYLAAAREAVEGDSGQVLVCQQWLTAWDQFGVLTLPYGPVIGILAVQYRDSVGTLQTVAATEYELDGFGTPATLVAAVGKTWPIPGAVANAVQVRYYAGYVTPFTASVITNKITLLGRTPQALEPLYVTNSGGALPAPLQANRLYSFANIVGTSASLVDAETGAVTLTSSGAGVHFIGEIPFTLLAAIKIMAGHLYENREATVSGQPVTALPLGYESLVWRDKIVRIA